MDENQQTTQDTTEVFAPSTQSEPMVPTSRRGARGKKSKGLIIVIVLLFLVGGVLLFMGRGRDGDEALATPTPELFGAIETPTTIIESTPTPAPVDKSEIDIRVLNGTGIGGAAGFLQDKLTDLGYTSVEVGNAGSQDHEVTTVTFGNDVADEVIDEITEELESLYEDVTVNNASSSLNVDVEITTGLQKGQTPLPESTSTPAASASPSPSPSASPTN